MGKWKHGLVTAMLTTGLVLHSFAPVVAAKTTTISNAKGSAVGTTNNEKAKLPFLKQNTGGPFDLGLVNEDKVLNLLIKQGIVSKTASKEVQTKQLQAYFAKRADQAEELGTDQQEAKQVRTELQDKAGLDLKPAGNLKDTDIKQNLQSKKSTYVDPIQKETWNGPVRKDKVLVLLIEYPDFPHNQIKREDGPVLLYNDFTQKHYENMIFGDNGYEGPDGQNLISVKQFYEQQSGGSYSIEGKVSKWYQASQSAAYYGGNDPLSQNDDHPQDLIKEALAQAAQDPSIHLNDFDIEDQFDLDGDGNYREPDGIIDHLMVVHSGIGEEAGGGTLGENAIWSHSSSIFPLSTIPNTSTDVPYWDGQLMGYGYTIQPEDGAAGVFAHEFGHNLGLPDEYDTIYTQDGVGAPTGFWTIMSGGSWAGKIAGTEPTGFSPYCKDYLQMTMPESNWFKDVEYNLDNLKKTQSIKLDEASVKGTNADAIKINLPDKTTVINTPASGQYEYFSGSGDYLDNSMTTAVDLTKASKAELKFKTWYSIEQDFDYAYVEVSDDNGDTWTAVQGNITTTANPNDANLGNGITGDSNGWKDATFDLSAYAGKSVKIRFHYISDPGVALPGFYVDTIQVISDGQTISSDNADEGTSIFELEGFEKNNGVKVSSQYYLIEWRNYAAADEALAHISSGNSMMTYDRGLVVWYVDNKYTDNWVGDHPGEGFVGVVDAHQETANWKDSNPSDGIDGNGVASTDYQIQDAAFSLNNTDETYLDYKDIQGFGRYLELGSQPAATVFDDSRDYSNPGQIYAGRNVPKYGLKIHVVGQADDMSVGAIELHAGSEQTLDLNPLNSEVFSNHEGHNQIHLSGKVHDDGSGESLEVKYEILNSKGEAVLAENETLAGLFQTIEHRVKLPENTPTGDYTVKVTAANASGQVTSNQLSFKVDNDPPAISVDRNGNSSPLKELAVKVTLTDADPATLGYVWSMDKAAPTEGWKTFSNEEIVKLMGENGKWYLHVRANDRLGNSLNWTSDSFTLDTIAPIIQLKGSNPLKWEKGKEFKDPGYKAEDNIDGETSSSVTTAGTIDVNKMGEYKLTYTSTDKAGNMSSVTRIVKVVENESSSVGNSAGTASGPGKGGGWLPNTMTNMYNWLLSGFIMITIGLTLFVLQKRRKSFI